MSQMLLKEKNKLATYGGNILANITIYFVLLF